MVTISQQVFSDELWAEWMRRPGHLEQYSLQEFADLRLGETTSIPVVSSPVDLTSSVGRGRHESGVMNKLEERYSKYLELRRQTGEIRAWAFEPWKLRLAPKTFYSFDFAVRTAGGGIELHEVKGFWEDDARVKIKWAAKDFAPFFAVVAVTWDKQAKDWKFERFKVEVTL